MRMSPAVFPLSVEPLLMGVSTLIDYCVEANQMAYFGESAAVAFSLENIEEIARDLSANTFQAILERLTVGAGRG